MRKNLTPRTVLVLGVLGLCVVFLLPNIFGKETIQFGPARLDSINLGLDLKGGMHVVLAVQTEKAITDEVGNDAKRLDEALAEKNAKPASVEVVDGLRLRLTFATDAMREQAKAYLNEYWSRYEIDDQGSALVLAMDPREIDYLKQNALLQAQETITNRIDEFAVKEPQIYTQGSDQIVVRLPGIVDPERAKSLIGKTAVLEFKILAEPGHRANTREELEQRFGSLLNQGYEIYASSEKERNLGGYYLLKKVPDASGKDLVDARRSVDNLQRPAVSFQFGSGGAKQFAELTGANIGKPLVILLDDKVVSAPNVQSRIFAHGQITGDFTNDEARDLAIVLRAGSLPVPVEIEEERTVGPTLGEDSIKKGFLSFIVGGAAVVIFMIIYYRRAGAIAVGALVANVLMIMGGLALFGATLTLPGIAGIILTIGMAVDANVIVNERIREELRAGKTPRSAVESGYDKALSAVLDSNITTALAGIFLYQFGTGPIRGFAVTLMIGLAATVFTAVICTRLVYDHIFQRRRTMKTLSI
ncbi:protein translocase subunit SecD [bacterium]|nr:protein translocase subunit SecD [bacterium]